MTRCVKGPWSHDFPIEDPTGVYCPRNGVALLFNQPEYLDDDLGRTAASGARRGTAGRDRRMTAPVNTAAIQAALRAALVVRGDTPREDMAALADTVASYIAQLLPAGRADARRLWRGGIPWHQLTARLNGIQRGAAACLPR